jgi:hypothetical protein
VALVARKVFELDAPWLVIFALVTTGTGVAIRPYSPLVLGPAALSGLIGYAAMSWDSARLVIVALTAVAAAGAVLMLLPSTIRRLAVSLVIVFHFGGILTAVTSVPPQPWLSYLAWVYVYRPYLEFMYLNNAYHFYAPQPGPAAFIWFYVRYEDGSGQWVKIPRRQDHPLALEYQRRLSLTENVGINQTTQMSITEELLLARRLAGNIHGIPLHPGFPPYVQRREPNVYAKRLLEAYARFIARSTPHPLDGALKVSSVKIYCGIHDIPGAKNVAAGEDPDAPWQYYAYYRGEYDPEGKLLDPHDPFLYWLIPILRDDQSSSMASGSSGVFRASVGSAKRPKEEHPSDGMEVLEKHAKLRIDIPEDRDPAPLPEQPKATPSEKERVGAESSAR